MTRISGIVALLSTCAVTAVASAEEARAVAPRLSPDSSGHVEVVGLPAISGDGSAVAVVEYFETLSDADRLVILILDAADGSLRETLFVHESDERGRLLPFPSDGLGATVWRRARTVSDRLAAEGYRALPSVGEEAMVGAPEMLEGAGLRILQRPGSGRYTIRDAGTGRRISSGRFAPTTSFCGMSDDAPSEVPPSILRAWWDAASRTVVLSYGHAYASCMCPDDVSFTALRVDP